MSSSPIHKVTPSATPYGSATSLPSPTAPAHLRTSPRPRSISAPHSRPWAPEIDHRLKKLPLKDREIALLEARHLVKRELSREVCCVDPTPTPPPLIGDVDTSTRKKYFDFLSCHPEYREYLWLEGEYRANARNHQRDPNIPILHTPPTHPPIRRCQVPLTSEFQSDGVLFSLSQLTREDRRKVVETACEKRETACAGFRGSPGSPSGSPIPPNPEILDIGRTIAQQFLRSPERGLLYPRSASNPTRTESPHRSKI